ncbi:MAG TPA: VWA domain-containing protein [Candidatus Acidoferrales bacterium]|nr:VWA domain-containing protein [Candidatus Acidoferrales bacterium]
MPGHIDLALQWPWALLGWLLLPWLAWQIRRRRVTAPALRFTKVGQAALLPTTRRQGWWKLPAQLRLAAAGLLALAMAGPQLNPRRVRDITRTIGIQLLVDCSGSMAKQDMVFDNKPTTRIDLVRRVSKEFVFGDGLFSDRLFGDRLFSDNHGLPGRDADMIGIIGFAVAPVTLCPLTLAHEHLRPALDGLRIAQDSDGTAIGDAIAVAAARFRRIETTAAGQFKSKAIVLLTDGENNSGARSVADAARLARDWGVRVYAIGIRPPNRGQDAASADLQMLAGQTNGLTGTVQDEKGLRAIYAEIDKLEKSDRAVPRFSGGRELQYGLGGTAMLLLVLEIVLSQTWLRRIP